jgi:hypothetical protein
MGIPKRKSGKNLRQVLVNIYIWPGASQRGAIQPAIATSPTPRFHAVSQGASLRPPHERSLRHSGHYEPRLRRRCALSSGHRTRCYWSTRTDVPNPDRLHRCPKPSHCKDSTGRQASTGLAVCTGGFRSPLHIPRALQPWGPQNNRMAGTRSPSEARMHG